MSDITNWRQALSVSEDRFDIIADKQDNGLVYQTEAMFAMQSIKKSEALQNCNPLSVRDAIINVASIGLSLNPATAFAYLIPRKGVCCLDISYRGLTDIATSSGAVIWAKAVLVYEDDTFEFQNIDKMPIHKTDPFKKERGMIRGGYCAAKLHDSQPGKPSYLVDFMGIDEIMKVKAVSKAKSGPWLDWPEEMMKKSLVKRASKSWPKNGRLSEAINVINKHEGFDDAPPATEASGAVELMISDDQVTELTDMVTEANLNPDRIFRAFKITRIEDLPAAQYEECKGRLATAVDASKQKAAASTTAESASPATGGGRA